MENINSLHTTTNLFAYLDGGTGSMILQAGLAGILTAAYVVKSKWNLLKATITRKNRQNP